MHLNKKKSAVLLTVACTGLLLLSHGAPARGQIVLAETENGWSAVLTGLISVWSGQASWDVGSGNEDSFRVTTGFNPSKIEFIVSAPEAKGLKVSTYFQLATSLQGFKTRRVGEQIEVRGASINVDGSFGTFQIGRNFAIYSSNAIFADTGSMRGTGYICTSPDGSGPNCGHIGTGYTWSDWTAGLRYFTPRTNGFQLKAGLFDPVETAFGFPGGDAFVVGSGDAAGVFNGLFFNFTDIGGVGPIETSTPMVEAELSYLKPWGDANSLMLWGGILNQDVDDLGGGDTTLTGVNFGGRLKVGGLGITTNFEETEGIAEGFIAFGAKCNEAGCDAVDGDGWYVNVDYTTPAGTTFGASYGEGHEDANAVIGNDEVDRELTMVFVQHQLTPNFNVNVEYHDFSRTTANGGFAAGPFQPNEEYSAVLFGGEFRF